ncbi:MAG: heme exporter protein CcmD [Rhodospirillaceae bacterium]|nr:heme exporter protein CcmD [Rhodospirillaceae bacterium]
MSEFLNMGGHAGYIWPAYGIVAVVLVGLFIAGRRFQHASDDELAALNPRSRRKSEPVPETTPETTNET